jgi:hypothetical protein
LMDSLMIDKPVAFILGEAAKDPRWVDARAAVAEDRRESETADAAFYGRAKALFVMDKIERTIERYRTERMIEQGFHFNAGEAV